jgi:hypothetical protein
VGRRANYRGRPVLYPLGVILLAGAGLALAAGPSRWLAFLLGVGCLGLTDDLVGGEPRGLRGHGLALLRGELSTGPIKAVGTVALAAYAIAGEGGRGAELIIEGARARIGGAPGQPARHAAGAA